MMATPKLPPILRIRLKMLVAWPIFFLGDARHAVGHQPDEQKAESDALEHLRPENVPVARVEVEVGERKHGERRKRPQAN